MQSSSNADFEQGRSVHSSYKIRQFSFPLLLKIAFLRVAPWNSKCLADERNNLETWLVRRSLPSMRVVQCCPLRVHCIRPSRFLIHDRCCTSGKLSALLPFQRAQSLSKKNTDLVFFDDAQQVSTWNNMFIFTNYKVSEHILDIYSTYCDH